MPIFTARREKIRKTNVKFIFSIFYSEGYASAAGPHKCSVLGGLEAWGLGILEALRLGWASWGCLGQSWDLLGRSWVVL